MNRAARVLYVQYTNPAAYPPLEHSAHVLAEAGADVRLLGTAILGDALTFKPHTRIRVDLRPFQGRGWRQKQHYLSFAVWAVAETARWRPTWIYASEPLSCPIALACQLVSGARVIYHEHDSPDTTAARSIFERAVLRARRRLARRATRCILPNEQRAERFAAGTGSTRVTTVWNCPMQEDVAPVRADRAAGQLRLVYHGSIVPARLPTSVVDAIATLPAVTLQMAGYETAGHAGYVQSLLDRARALGCGDRVAYHGTIPNRAGLLRLCAKGDVGLALMPANSSDANERAMTGASNKPFDYLASGLALLVADLPDWTEMFVRSGYGVACQVESPDSIANALRWLLEHPEERRAMGDRGRLKIREDWHYERVFAPVLREMLATESATPQVERQNVEART